MAEPEDQERGEAAPVSVGGRIREACPGPRPGPPVQEELVAVTEESTLDPQVGQWSQQVLTRGRWTDRGLRGQQAWGTSGFPSEPWAGAQPASRLGLLTVREKER